MDEAGDWKSAQLKARITKAETMEAIVHLTGSVAHDFNNLLTAIQGSMQLVIKRTTEHDPESARLLSTAMKAVERGTALTHRLLAFSRRQALAPENLDLNQHVMTVADLFRERLGEAIQIETKLQEGLWQCFADLAEVDSALLNLIVNARDAMKGGGKLTIETRNVVVDDFYAKAHDDHAEISLGEYVMIAVSDTGVGMSANVLGHAVEPFFTTKGALGTGLGLSQVHGFVKQSGGFLKIESEPGQGTTIKIYLPRHLGEPASGDASKFLAERSISADERAPPKREAVLVVEDDEQVREFSAAAVENLGYRVVVAENAASALRALADHPEIALLFTDLGLPDIDGYELAQEARRRVPSLKVVYTTGYTPDTVARFRDIEPLAKPFKLEDLAKKLQEALRKL